MKWIFGGNPAQKILHLIIISVVVGIVLSALGYDPRELLKAIPGLIQAFYDFGFVWVEKGFRYFLLGAVIVIPLWLIISFLQLVFGNSRKGK